VEDAAYGTAVYSAPLASQPVTVSVTSAGTSSAAHVQVTGVAAHTDHIVISVEGSRGRPSMHFRYSPKS
jgi:hypothetical protein